MFFRKKHLSLRGNSFLNFKSMNTVIKRLVCVSILLLSLLSCDRDEQIEEVERGYRLCIKIEYVHRSENRPDAGSKVYIYFNHKQEDFISLQYDKEGVYYSEGKIIKPDDTYTANVDGMVSIDFKEHLNVEFSMVVESCKKEGLRGFLYIEEYDFEDNGVLSFKFQGHED